MLKGERIIIRAFERSDFPVLYQYHDVGVMNFYAITCAFPISRDAYEQWLTDIAKRPGTKYWAIEEKDHGVVGTIGLFDMDPYVRTCNIGFYIAPPFQKKNIGGDAVLTVLDFVFGDMNYNKVNGETMELNVPAQKLLERLGFKKEGELRACWRYQHETYSKLLYGMLRDEYYAAHPPRMSLPFEKQLHKR